MPSYHCYFLDEDEHIKAREDIEAEKLRDAMEQALLMLKARPQHSKVELWEGARRVFPAGYGNVIPGQVRNPPQSQLR
jgi:hypothetical protein